MYEDEHELTGSIYYLHRLMHEWNLQIVKWNKLLRTYKERKSKCRWILDELLDGFLLLSLIAANLEYTFSILVIAA